MNLRAAQREILKYKSGRMAISAVPGSGKTFTLSLLAAELLAHGLADVNAGQQVLVVTYLNSSVDTFRSRIRQRLDELVRPQEGYDVRTLHSLALEIVRLDSGGDDPDGLPLVAGEVQVTSFIARAVDGWIEAQQEFWLSFLENDNPQIRVRWRDITERTARVFIRSAKNDRYSPDDIFVQLEKKAQNDTDDEFNDPGDHFAFLWMLANIYMRYQSSLDRAGVMDFDDLIWRAADLLQTRPDIVNELSHRWPYVLEDEAQDSVPLQENLLDALTRGSGNWVRVGDPNQAITSTFTAAHPRFFNLFLDDPAVFTLPLPNSGRCAPKIYQAANALVRWTCDHHPIQEVREHAFRRQEILPTPPADAQPNPPDADSQVLIKVFKHREEEELPVIARLAAEFTQKHPEYTLAILVPTNEAGYQISNHLDSLHADYDNLLRGSNREREIAAVLHSLLDLLASPLSTKALEATYSSMLELGHPIVTSEKTDPERLRILLRSIHHPESFMFPGKDTAFEESLPIGIVDEAEYVILERFAAFLSQRFELRQLPIDDMILALSDELFNASDYSSQGIGENEMAIAYQIANAARQWREMQPEWRLPELAAQLLDIAQGRKQLWLYGPNDLGYTPKPSRITLATQHGAKGMEWDAVFLVGMDGVWLPGNLDAAFVGVHDFLGGDPSAEAVAQLRHLMDGDAGLYNDRTATESAHIDVICERLRLFYVGITRARRYLHISRSRMTRRYAKDLTAEPATALGVIYRFWKEY